MERNRNRWPRSCTAPTEQEVTRSTSGSIMKRGILSLSSWWDGIHSIRLCSSSRGSYSTSQSVSWVTKKAKSWPQRRRRRRRGKNVPHDPQNPHHHHHFFAGIFFFTPIPTTVVRGRNINQTCRHEEAIRDKFEAFPVSEIVVMMVIRIKEVHSYERKRDLDLGEFETGRVAVGVTICTNFWLG